MKLLIGILSLAGALAYAGCEGDFVDGDTQKVVVRGPHAQFLFDFLTKVPNAQGESALRKIRKETENGIQETIQAVYLQYSTSVASVDIWLMETEVNQSSHLSVSTVGAGSELKSILMKQDLYPDYKGVIRLLYLECFREVHLTQSDKWIYACDVLFDDSDRI